MNKKNIIILTEESFKGFDGFEDLTGCEHFRRACPKKTTLFSFIVY